MERPVCEFLERLTELSREFGLGLTGSVELYEMEGDDFLFAFHADENDQLSWD